MFILRAVLIALLLACGPAWAQAADFVAPNRAIGAVQLVGPNGLLATAANPAPMADQNGAAYQGVVVITPGTSTPALRSLGYICTAAGNITLTLADASTITVPIAVGGFATLPFAVTNVALGSGTAGNFWNLK